MPPPKLILVYAGYGDTLLLEYQKQNAHTPEYWLIDGGPVSTKPGKKKNASREFKPDEHAFNAYYQFLQQALRRFCSSDGKTIDRLSGIIVTHPHADHMDGVIQLVVDWLPKSEDRATSSLPLKSFEGPILLNNEFFPGDKNKSFLSSILSKRGFKRKNIGPDDVSIPAGMSNVSYPQHIRKMVYDPTGGDEEDLGNPAPDDFPGEERMKGGGALTIDDSPQNIASIITTWDDGTNPPIVTTGDSIGSRVLRPVRSLLNPTVSKPSLGIFKLPHHGSQRNSQISTRYQVTKAETDKEKLHYFFLILVCWSPPRPPNQSNPSDSDYLRRAKVQFTENWQDDWIRRQPTGVQRDANRFANKMKAVADGFRKFIQSRELKNESASASLDLRDDTTLWTLAVRIARRHFELLQSVYRQDATETANKRALDYLDNLQVRKATFKEPFRGLFVPEDFLDDTECFPSSRKHDVNWSYRRDPECEDLYNSLFTDPSEHAAYFSGMVEFYKAVRATKYAVSANGEHGHPSPNTVAALMISALEDVSPQRRQLFVTDGAALDVDLINQIVTELLRERPNNQPLAHDQWRNRIGVYYLDTDYCAPIPSTTDPSDIAGCRELDIGANDARSARDVLHQQFNRASAFDVPRATEPVSSSFQISVSFKTRPGVFSLGFNDASQTFQMANSTNSLFHLSPVSADPPASRGSISYMISASPINNPAYSGVYNAGSVTLPSGTTKGGPAMFHMCDSSGNFLSYKSPTELEFKREKNDAAQLSFVRKTGFGLPPLDRAVVDSASRPSETNFNPRPEVALYYPTVYSETLDKPSAEPAEEFLAWWKRVNPTGSASKIQLLEVAEIVLGKIRAQALFESIPPKQSGFIFSDIGELLVDAEASPSVARAEPEAQVVQCVLVLDHEVKFPGFAGLDSVNVTSLKATISAKDSTLELDVDVSDFTKATCHFIFGGKTSLERFVEELNSQLDPRNLSLAALGAIIIGPDCLWAFISNLPKPLTSAISLPNLLIDYQKTKIEYTKNPFGLDVTSANLVLASTNLPSITVGTFNFALAGGAFEIVSKQFDLFDITLQFVVELLVGTKKLQCSFTATSDGVNPVILDVATRQTAPSDILEFLGFGPSSPPLSIPLDGGETNLSVALHTVGFTLVQPTAGSTGLLDLATVYFKIGADWKPWEKVLPVHIQPNPTPELLVTVALVRPKPQSPFVVGLQLDYALDVDASRAKFLFEMSHWPIKGLQNSYRTSVEFRNDEESGLPPASIDDVLARFTGTSWKQVTDSIPALGSITKAISVTQGSLAIDDGKKVSAFSIHAQIQDLVLLSSPSLKVEEAGLIVGYNGTSWNGRFVSRFLFADKFRCAAEVILPSVDTTGLISFRNLDDKFTTNELAKAINPSIDLSTVPIVGGDFLANLRLDQAAIEMVYDEEKHYISSFLVALTWDPDDIGQLKTSGNRLSIRWHKGSPAQPIRSIEDSGASSKETATTGSTWAVSWEGILFTDWHLSATLRHSSLKTAEGASKSVTVLSGAIIDSAGRIHSGSLINSFTSTSSTPDNSADSLWNQTVPSHVTPSFELKDCAVNLVLGDGIQTFGVGARATWGKAGEGIGLVLIERIKAPAENESKWGFAFAISVSNFRFSDLLMSSSLAKTIDDTLAITRVSVLVFRNPESTEMSRVYQLVKNASACGLVPPGISLLPPENQDEKTSPKITTGAAVFALLNFQGAKEGSLTHRLDTIGGSGLSSVELMGYFGKGTGQTTTTLFSASISSIPLFESVLLEEIKLSYTPVVSTIEGKPDSSIVNTFLLAANCRIQFSLESIWIIKGSLTITKEVAKLAASLKEASELSETFGLSISEIDFSIAYTFSSSSNSSRDGTDKAASKPKSVITLGAKAQIVLVKAEASIEFDDGKPAVLLVNVPGELSVSDLINQIFSTTIPSDVLDIKFSKFFMYYAWKASSALPSPEDPKARSYIAGFHAEADTDVFGVVFILAVEILGGDDKRVTISGTKKTPVEVIGLVLHGADSEAEGPKFSFSTGKNKGCSIAAGLKLFGTPIGSVTFAYNSAKSQFLGTVVVKAQFLPGGQASVSFELTKKNGKHVFRVVEIPAAFDDLIQAMHIIDTIKKLSAADGSPCGAITLAFDQLSTKLRVKVNIPDSQKGISPDQGTEGASHLNLSVTGYFDIKVFDRTVSSIEFRPFIVTIDIPQSFTFEDFGKSLASSLEKSAGQIVQGLWDNQDKLTEVIAIIALKKLSEKALTTLVCRGKYTPETGPGNEPGPDQDPPGDDGGGPDGDGGGGEGGGGGGGGGAGAAGGGTAAAAAAAAAGAAGGLLGGILDLFGHVFEPDSDLTPPKRPDETSGPPPVPPESDVIGQHIHTAITKDFARWKKCADYQTAIDTALACALEYRDAVFLLRKVLGSKQSVSKLGKHVYKDYTQRLEVLLYDFSMMSRQFAERWLDMTDYEVELRVHSSSANGRKLDVSWDPLRLKGPIITAVTVQIEGEKEPRLKLKSFENATKTTIDIPPFSTSEDLAVRVQVSALGAVWGGDPKYAFFSQGKPAYGLLEEDPIGTTTLDFNREFPTFTLRNAGNTLTANGNMPVFLLGSHRYWPMNYVDGRNAFGLVAQSTGTLRQVHQWKKEGEKSIHRINFDASTVTFTGESGRDIMFTLQELSLPNSRYLRTRLAIRDASSQPPIQLQGLKYETSVEDVKKYPVALVGSRTWWPVLYSGSPMIALVGYESDLKPLRPITWRLDQAGSGRIGRLEHVLNQDQPNNNKVEVYDTNGQRITMFGFESLLN